MNRPAESPESRMRSLKIKPNSQVLRVRQARSHCFENLGILASYARDAGQEAGESWFPDPCHRNAGITSRANRSTECRASSTVMSPKASQGTK
jgi:hypothetical protein